MSESEIVPGEYKVSEDNGNSSKNEQAQETEDVPLDHGSFLDGERMPDLRQGGPNRCFFEGSKPFVSVSLLFFGKRNAVQLPLITHSA
jgi:hypothetical protein